MECHHLMDGNAFGAELNFLRLESVFKGLVVNNLDALDFLLDSCVGLSVLEIK